MARYRRQSCRSPFGSLETPGHCGRPRSTSGDSEQRLDRRAALRFSGRESRHDGGIKVGESPSVMGTLPQDRVPTESCLGPFEDEKLKPAAVIVDRNSPLLVVVLDR